MSLTMKKNGHEFRPEQAPTPEERVLAVLEKKMESMSDEEIEKRLEATEKVFAARYGTGARTRRAHRAKLAGK
jgi:hypothetical protein